MDTFQVRYRVFLALVLPFFTHSFDLFADELFAADRQAVDELTEAFPEHTMALEATGDFLIEHRLRDGDLTGLGRHKR